MACRFFFGLPSVVQPVVQLQRYGIYPSRAFSLVSAGHIHVIGWSERMQFIGPNDAFTSSYDEEAYVLQLN